MKPYIITIQAEIEVPDHVDAEGVNDHISETVHTAFIHTNIKIDYIDIKEDDSGIILKEYREKRNLSQIELANLLMTNQITIHRVESGQQRGRHLVSRLNNL